MHVITTLGVPREQQLVREFHEAIGHPVALEPTLVDEKVYKLRHKLIAEELKEYLDACKAGDIVEIADAIGDLLYVVYGTAVAHGVNAGPVFEEIHRSNWSKLDADGKAVPHPTIPGKAGKSALYTPPALAPILEAQDRL